MQDPDFSEIVSLICKEDPRFDRKAYDFVRLGLDHTVKELRKRDATRAEKSRHVSGGELLDGLRIYALDQFGPLTKTVLNAWGVSRCTHFGDIVFQPDRIQRVFENGERSPRGLCGYLRFRRRVREAVSTDQAAADGRAGSAATEAFGGGLSGRAAAGAGRPRCLPAF
jgi:uncharacterized repeat protein (TIGR04138 family)